MATRQIKKTTSTITSESKDNSTIEKDVIKNKKEARKFEPSDGIECRSITVGGLYMEGIKSHIVYEWADEGDTTFVEYQDLIAGLRSKSSYLMSPLFIVEDEEFVEQNEILKSLYDSMYSIDDLRGVIFDLKPSDMIATLKTLPKGAQDSIRSMASQLVSSGELDSVNKIKALDEYFDTKIMLMTGLND